MKIYDLLGSNKNTAAINLYGAKYGLTLSEIQNERILSMLTKRQSFFVFLDESGLDISIMRERSELLGKIVYGHVMRGTVLFFHDCSFREITRKNWAKSWKMITPKKPYVQNDKILVPKREKTAFDDGMPGETYKKPAKRGFQRTIMANISLNAISGIVV